MALTLKYREQTAQYFTESFGDGFSLDMMQIPAGTFVMGTPDEEIERLCKEYETDWMKTESPQHWENVSQFFLGKYPVTQAQWRIVSGWEKVEISLDPDPAAFKGDNRPVENVSWDDAQEFCARLSRESKRDYRLPSEAEWEYACRAIFPPLEKGARGDLDQWNELYHQPFHFGETLSDEVANYAATKVYGRGKKGNKRGDTTPVGTFPANNFGLYDMHGNVWEWCEDYFSEDYRYASGDSRNPKAWFENDDERHVLRGGSWNYSPWYCRSACRHDLSRDSRNLNIGFRVACSLPGSP